MRTPRMLFAIAGSAAVLATLAGCGSSASPGGPAGGTAGAALGSAAVTIKATDDLKFDPTSRTAKVGDIVQWTNVGAVLHDVTFEDPNSSLTDSTLNSGDTWQVRFTAAGTYPYTCRIHPGMSGTVTVEP